MSPFARTCVVALCCLFAQAAGAVDLEEMKRLARLEASAEAQKDKPLPAGPALSGGASPMQKLARGIEQAHAAAPNKWYQAAKIEDITPPGDDQRKIYRITGVLGTYCVRYPDKNKVDQGRAYVGEPLLGACPHMF